jgi:hypothetical protein
MIVFFIKEKKNADPDVFLFFACICNIYSITSRLRSTYKPKKDLCVGVCVYEKKYSTLFDLVLSECLLYLILLLSLPKKY